MDLVAEPIREQKSMISFPRMNRMKTISSVLFTKSIAGPYLNTYYIMKAQKTILTNFRSKVMDIAPKNMTERVEKLVSSLRELERCSMADLYEGATEQMAFLKDLLGDASVNREFENSLEICFKALLTLTRRIYAVAYEQGGVDSSPVSPAARPSDGDNFSFLCEDDLVVCRICDEAVRIEDFEAHTASCIEAYRNESRIEQINKELEAFMGEIKGLLDGVGWPSDANEAVNRNLPLLNAFLLVDRVLHLDANSPDAGYECAVVIESLGGVIRVLDSLKLEKLMCDIKEKVNEKRHTAIAIRENEDVLRRTRVSGDAEASKLTSISIADFTFIKLISAGAYARVFLAQKNKTGDIFAVKVQPKMEIMQKNQVERVLLEKDLMLQFRNPYIINFYYSIVGRHNLYIVMEYLPGGDLYSLLAKLGGLDEDNTETYMFQIASALNYLHGLGIIHRDLKPDNVLVSSSGTLKLTDFGLSYRGFLGRHTAQDTDVVQAKSMVGTPDYISPEIVMQKPHTFTVDWWSLGIMIYEFMMGEPPFHAEKEMEIYANIIKGKYELPTEEDGVSPECIDIITRLLDPNPDTRLGAHGGDEVLNHPWFAGLKESELTPPFVPELKSEEDTEYFECRYKFEEDNDKDIREDIEEAKARQVALQPRSKSASFSRFYAGPSFSSDCLDDEEGISGFPSISVSQLEEANREALKKALPQSEADGRERRKPMKSFDSMRDLNSSRRKRRRHHFSSFSSQDDSVLSDRSVHFGSCHWE